MKKELKEMLEWMSSAANSSTDLTDDTAPVKLASIRLTDARTSVQLDVCNAEPSEKNSLAPVKPTFNKTPSVHLPYYYPENISRAQQQSL